MNEHDDEYEDDNESTSDTIYLTFSLASSDYAIHVSHVLEIVRLQRIFSVPDVASYIRGVINLRGKVIPLLDVRARFGLPDAQYTDRTVVVVIEVDGAHTGLIVDGVFGISEFTANTIEPAPSAFQSSGCRLVRSLARRNDRVNLIIDVPALVASSGGPVDVDAAHATTN